jgi:hypothetical protein
MNKFIITEEEKKRILNMHETRSKNHYLMEQSEDEIAKEIEATMPEDENEDPGFLDRLMKKFNIDFNFLKSPKFQSKLMRKRNSFLGRMSRHNNRGFMKARR